MGAASSELHVELAPQKLAASLCRYKSRTYPASYAPPRHPISVLPYKLCLIYCDPPYLHGAHIERIVALIHVEGFVVQRAAAEVLDMFCNERERMRWEVLVEHTHMSTLSIRRVLHDVYVN